MPIIDALQWRYATKKFDTAKHLTEAQLHTALEALRLSPSSYGLQPWTFIVTKDPAVREAIRQHAWDQAQVTDASHLIVLCGKNTLTEEDVDAYVADIAQSRGVPVGSIAGYREMMVASIKRQTPEGLRAWIDKQVYIALGVLLASCASERIDACPMEGFDATQVDALLKLSDRGIHSVVLCPVGFRAADDATAAHHKVRFAREKVVDVR
jgi:nitroreductase